MINTHTTNPNFINFSQKSSKSSTNPPRTIPEKVQLARISIRQTG